MDLEMRPITEGEFEAWLRADFRAFGHHLSEESLPLIRPGIHLNRTVAVFDDGMVVGGAHSNPFEMIVPGGALPVAGVERVSVQPTHRRRGLLTRMMGHQLRDIHERAEPLAALGTAESIIYGRFGYGNGSFHERWTIDRQHTAYARPFEPEGRVAFVQPDEMRQLFPDIYRRATKNRPGVIQRPGFAWDNLAADPEVLRDDGNALFHLSYEQDGHADGYVMYRIKGKTVMVQELMAATDQAYAALWRFCFDIDLRTSTEASDRPVDDPLPWMLADPRRLHRSLQDFMWLRLVDVPAALAGRRYAVEDRLVLEIRDSFCSWNEGRYKLEGSPEGAVCRHTSATQDLALSVADLASTYLGTVRFTTLSHAARVEERTPGALLRADAMFATQLQPWAPYSY
jgi:predicted acetyltransferase